MSIIVGYFGPNGAVVGGDKRTIFFRGSVENREQLEKKLYCGEIKSDEELKKIAEEHNVKIHIDDNNTKVRDINNILVGEVKSIGANSQRRRMYLTTGKCVILDIFNDEITKKSEKTGVGLILFGNRYLKDVVSKELNKYSKDFKNMPIEDVKKHIENAIKKCDGPTLSNEIIMLSTNKANPSFNNIIKKDFNDLVEYRSKLRNELIDMRRASIVAEKIENNGEVGYIKDSKLVLDKNHVAIDKICSNPTVFEEIEVEGNVEDGDIIYIDNEGLKVKGKEEPIKVNKIICKA